MATVPDAPQIRIRPKVNETSLEFFWAPPLSDGGDPITSYQIYDLGNSLSNDIAAPAFTGVIGGLTTGTPYSFSITASNSVGQGPALQFRTVQVGIKPQAPSGVFLKPESASTATLFYTLFGTYATDPFTFPTTPELLATVICAPQEINGQIQNPAKNFVLKQSQYPNYSTQTIEVTSDLSYNFIVRAVNDAGYSPLPPFPGTINLTPQTISTNVIVFNYAASANVTEAVQVVGEGISPPLTSGIPFGQNLFSSKTNKFGHVNCIDATFNLVIYDKQGFLKHITSSISGNPIDLIGRTNPYSYFVADPGSGVFNYTVYDNINNTSFISTLTEEGYILYTGVNNWENNAYFRTLDSLTNTSTSIHLLQASSISTIFNAPEEVVSYENHNVINKSISILTSNASVGLFNNIIYIPQSENTQPNVINISSLGIEDLGGGGLSAFSNLTGSKCCILGLTNQKLYTFDLTQPAETALLFEQDFSDISGTQLFTLDISSYSNYYNGISSIGAFALEGSTNTIGYNFYCPYVSASRTYVDDFNFISNYAISPTLGVAFGYNATGEWKVVAINNDGLISSFNLTDMDDIPVNNTDFPYIESLNLNISSLSFQLYDPSATSTIAYTINTNYELYKSSFYESGGILLSGTMTKYQTSGIDYSLISTSVFQFTSNAPPQQIQNFYADGIYQTNPVSDSALFKYPESTCVDIYRVSTLVSTIDLGFSTATTTIISGPNFWYGYNQDSNIKFFYLDENGFYKTQMETGTLVNYNNKFDSGFAIHYIDLSNKERIISYNSTNSTFKVVPASDGTYSYDTTYEPFIS